MKHQPYKYRIHYLLRQLSIEDYQIAMKFLPELCEISSKTFNEYIYRKADVSKNIPVDVILKLARFFEVTPEEMLEVSPSEEAVRSLFHKFKEKHFPNHIHAIKFL